MVKSQLAVEHFQELKLQKPSDLIIQQIKNLISSDVLKPGHRLPSERSLADRFRVGRGHIREALQKLEFYGILETIPQKGTYVVDLGLKALEGLISNVLSFEREDFESLLEARALLEIHAARLCATRASKKELEEIEYAHKTFKKKVEEGEFGLEEDLLFHLKIAQYCKNNVIRSLLSIVTPDIIRQSIEFKTCRDGRFLEAFKEHEQIMLALRQRDPERTEMAMREHMNISRIERGSSKSEEPLKNEAKHEI
jgi:GntR family transcriptional repressor for pyruvate dehydrogenase complex